MSELERQKQDPTAEKRKKDHIELAEKSRTPNLDSRFDYEPLLSSHPKDGDSGVFPFLGYNLRSPIWVSSMTGGTEWARTINHNLARACRSYGMGLGLGSCRSLLYSDEHLSDFDVRELIGEDLPLYANLGIAQVEQLISDKKTAKISCMLDRLSADGLIVHVNPMQEWLQPEGDLLKHAPLDTIQRLLDVFSKPIIVKEVGQGMGPRSLEKLMCLPLAGIEFAAAGGTNFAMLEMLRHSEDQLEAYRALANVGHSAAEMTDMINDIMQSNTPAADKWPDIIISGGVRSFLDGYYLINKVKTNAIYGQASAFLKPARESYEALDKHLHNQVEGLKMAYSFLKIRN